MEIPKKMPNNLRVPGASEFRRGGQSLVADNKSFLSDARCSEMLMGPVAKCCCVCVCAFACLFELDVP